MANAPSIAEFFDRNDTHFAETKRQWNGMIDCNPGAIARCGSAEEVAEAVRWAAERDMQVTVRGGGHGVSGLAQADDALLIDLGPMNSVTVDPEKRIARVGGGALLGDLDKATQTHGLAVTAGVEPETGAGGLTLGGGIGFLARKLGLTIDSLVGAQAVLGDGRIIEVDDQHETDLMWALRGGGGGICAVTRFDFLLHTVGPKIVSAQVFYPWEEAEQVIAGYRDFMESAPDEIGAYALFVRVPEDEAFPAERHGSTAVAIIAMHCGANTSAAKNALEPLTTLGNPLLSVLDEIDYLTFQTSFAGAAPRNERYYWKSHFLRELSDEAISVMARWAEHLPGEYSNIFIEAIGGVVGRIPSDATAFPHRDALFNLGISTGWSDPAKDDEMIERTRQLFDAITPFATGGVYSNYLDADEAGRTEGAFGGNLARLLEIKSRYDPENRFLRNG